VLTPTCMAVSGMFSGYKLPTKMHAASEGDSSIDLSD